jgi:hypothetical protein
MKEQSNVRDWLILLMISLFVSMLSLSSCPLRALMGSKMRPISYGLQLGSVAEHFPLCATKHSQDPTLL